MIFNKNTFLFICSTFVFLFGSTYAVDPLPSWNEGPIKESLIQYVKDVLQADSIHFIPVEERIASFDQDGTLWVEQPMYTQMFFAIDRIRALAPNHPEWKEKEPFKSILEGNTPNLTESQAEQIIAITHSGMTVDAFHKDVNSWLEKALHPRYERPFTQLVYQPMLELMSFLRDHGFTVYIVSGGGQEFMRAYAQKVYGIPPERIIGTAEKVKYGYLNGQPALIKLPEVMFINDKGGKPEGINLIIGRVPVAAFGNSTGDQQMLEWTQSNKRKNLELLVHHDDAEREYAYGPKSKVGTFSDALMDEAKRRGWIIVSMKNDWKTIFP